MFPGQGFLIEVTLDEKTGEGVYRGENIMDGLWEMVFVKDDSVYYKNQLMIQLDDEWGDPATDVSNEELHVVSQLSWTIISEEAPINQASKLFGELDSLFALALAAEKYGWVKPETTASNIIDIKDGRHPLQELLVPSFIPNDCVMAGGPGEPDDIDEGHVLANRENANGPSFLILTGPNNSGKSIYMKQIALIVYLAHIGSYVPASQTTIGITDRILTRIATRETMMADESAFCIDLKQAAFTVNFATRRSLILTDEFGKGQPGMLEQASWQMLVGTHFHELHDHGVIPSGGGLEYAQLDVRLDPDAEELENQITYLYKLVPGPGGESLGILCAELMGVEGEVLERAEYFLKLLKSNFDILEALRNRSEDEVEEEERLRRAESVYWRFTTMSIPGLDAPWEELETVGERLRQCVDLGKEEMEVAGEVGEEDEVEGAEESAEEGDTAMEDGIW